MLVHKVVLFSLFCTLISGETSHLRVIVRRIHKEFSSATINLVGFESSSLSKFLLEPFEVPLGILTSPIPGESYKSQERNIILVVQVSRDFPKFHSFVNKIKNRKYVVVYGNTLAELHQYFSFFWEKHFTMIIGVAANITYAYFPFADDPVRELILANDDPLPDPLSDLNGFTIRTTFEIELPRVFWYNDQSGHRQIGGSSGMLLVEFLKRHNATFIQENNKNPNFQHLSNKNFDKQVDISMNTFEMITGLDRSYPIATLTWSIMVPINGYVDSSQYFLRPFQPMVWLYFGIILTYLITTDMLKDKLVNVPVDFWNSFSRIFKIFLNMPLHKPTTYAYRFYIQVRTLAFICVNFYLIYMTSFLTVYIKVNQYETIQDLIDNNFPVTMQDFDLELYSKLAHYPEGFEEIVVQLNEETFLRELKSMTNTSFAYAEGSDKLDFLLNSQIKPKFRIIRENLMEYYLGFILSPNSPFKEILNNFIFDVLRTGLMDKWTQNSYVQAVAEGFIHSDLGTALSEQTIKPLTLFHFKFAWICFGIGMVMAIGVFLGEIFLGLAFRRLLRKK